MRRGPEPGKIYLLEDDEIRVGRGSKNDLIIHDNEVSRNHARFIRTTSGYEIHDLGSSNGTYVNGQHIASSSWLLRSQCIIELGDSITLEYRMGDPAEDPDVAERELARRPIAVNERSYLVVSIEGQPEPAVYPLRGMSITVGRSTSNDIVIVEPELSREHFRMTLMPQGYFVEDMGSTNGTFINGDPLNGSRLLYANDILQVGTTVRFRLTNSPEAFIDKTTTSLLDRRDPTESTRRRRTQELAHIPDIAQSAPSPTEVGTGVEHVSLEEEILITYARDDWEKIAAPMVDALYEDGIKAWVDQYLIEGSSDWMLATEQARLECWLLVVVVSPKAMRSELVRRNWRHFQNREKPIILVIHEPVERMPIGANKLARVQFNPGVPDVAFQQLIGDIRRLRGDDV